MKCNSDYHADICPARRRNGDRVSEYPCRHKVEPPKPKTNADHIRSMSDEELVAWLEEVDFYGCDCCVYQRECRLEYDEAKHDCVAGRMGWLKQPYKEEV